MAYLRRRGLDVRLNTTLEEVTDSQVRLSDGTTVPTHTLVWTVGATPGPLAQALGLDTVKGRIVVYFVGTVPGHPRVFAAGDAAAAPDLTRPGQLTAMTAQHAQRQGKAIARYVAATLGHSTIKPSKTGTWFSAVDLGGCGRAVADPLHVPVSGPLANVITRGYHLYALPANRLRVATDWFNDIIEHRRLVELGLIPSAAPRSHGSRAHRHLRQVQWYSHSTTSSKCHAREHRGPPLCMPAAQRRIGQVVDRTANTVRAAGEDGVLARFLQENLCLGDVPSRAGIITDS